MRLKYALTLIGMTAINIGAEDATRAGISDKNLSPLSGEIKPAVVIAQRPVLPTVVDAVEAKYDVVYNLSDGTHITRRGGTRAWRNANPGNLRYTEFTQRMGAIGAAGGFAIFPDEITGTAALDSLLRSDKYRKMTMGQAVMEYAPPHENDTENYMASLRRMTGVHHTTKMHSLDSTQMQRVIRAIRHIEGWQPGVELHSDSTARFVDARLKLISDGGQRTI